MCVGGQDIPVTLRVDGGIEDGQWQSASDVRDTPTPQEDVQVTETTETEVMEPSAPLYKPVIERIDKLSERLPEKVAEETFEEVSPMMQEGFQMADNNQMDTMQMLERIMRNTRPRRPFNPRGPRGDGPFGKGGGSDPRKPTPRYQTLGANPQVAGLAGLFGGIKKGINPEQIMATPTQLPNFPQQQMATPMQPEVIEEQQQMEILGQPKQFAGGGIVNALMATPIGQAAIKQYAQGGEVEAQQIFEMAQTGASIEDILAGRARFFTTPRYRHAEVISDISDTLGLSAPVRRKRKEEQYQDDAGGSVPNEPETDVADDPNDPGGVPGGFQGVGGEYGGGGGTDFGGGTSKGSENFGPTLGDRFQSAARFASNFSPMFQLVKGVGNLISPPESRRGSWDLKKDGYGLPPVLPTEKLLSETKAPADNKGKGKGKGKGEFSDPPSPFDAPPTPGKDNDPNAVKGLASVLGMVDQGARGRSGYTPTNIDNLYADALYSPNKAMDYLMAGDDMMDTGKNVFTDYGDISQYGDKGGAGFAQTIADYQSAVAENNQGFTADADADYGFGETPGAGEDALGGIT